MASIGKTLKGEEGGSHTVSSEVVRGFGDFDPRAK